MNLSTSGMVANFRQDIVARQLSVSANSGASIYYPTSSAIKSNHETDKQAEENATWFFEYKALLNSKLTTLTTALTSAYTADLDASMTANKTQTYTWGGKNAMQGRTGEMVDLYPTGGDGIKETPLLDPGAGRTTVAYFHSFGFQSIVPNGATMTDVLGTGTLPADPISFRLDMNSTSSNLLNYTDSSLIGSSGGVPTASVQGTTTFLSGGSSGNNQIILDRLYVDLADNKNNNYFNNKPKGYRIDPYPTSIEGGDLASKPATDTDPRIKNIGNNLELTLYKFFSKPENYDLIRFGLMDELYIVGTSSLATGSQIQGSISLRYTSADTPGNPVQNSYIEMKQERYSCFYHS